MSASRDDARERALRDSWEHNADAWTSAVRERRIPSRRAGTDDAIVRACVRARGDQGLGRVLDVGCGEGWLARALAAQGAHVLGVDASAPLVEAARAAGGGPRYETLDYDDLADGARASGPWDLVVCNYSLLADPVAPLLAALARRLAPDGALVVQTVHPWAVAAAEPPYADGWRTETFACLGEAGAAPMPWYFRTMASWIAAVRAGGLVIARLDEPPNPAGGPPLSLVLECRAR